MITLRPYQTDLVERTRASLTSGRRAPLICAPCGSGKTVMFSYFTWSATSKGRRTLILTHRDELIEQVSETLNKFKVNHSFIAAGREFIYQTPVHVASVFSAVRRLNNIPKPDIIIIDEAHHAIVKSTWGKILEHFPHAFRIGVTATPERLSGEPLGDVFDDLIMGPSVRSLIDQDALCDYRLYAPKQIDLSNLHTRAGDFAKNELQAAVDKPTITGDAINEYRKLANGKRAIVFCVSIKHAVHVAEQFNKAGFRASSIDGTITTDLRKYHIQNFRNGNTQVLTSCDLISEGFDLPAIEVAIMLRPTQSLALHIQQTGRALRPMEGKEYAIILDHAGNCARHGMPCEERVWSLAGRSTKKQTGEDNGSVRICPVCFAANFPGRKDCVYCKFEFQIEAREVKQIEGDLTEVDIEAVRREQRQRQGQLQTVEQLTEEGKRRGMKNPYGWAKHVVEAREKNRLKRIRENAL